MTLEPDGPRSVIGHETARSIGKLSFGTLSLVFVLYLVTLLPGIDRLIPGTSVSFAALASAIVALAVAAILFYAASRFAALARAVVDGPREFVENVASVVHWLVVLAAILVAHRGLAPAVTALLDRAAWMHDVVFLLLAIPPLAVIAARLYVTLDPAAVLFADEIAGDRD